jgi:transposase
VILWVIHIWVKKLLLPNLTQPTVIVMDNATFHKDQAILDMIKTAGHIVEFLPPYSPDLNPIEHKWAEKKHLYENIAVLLKSVIVVILW